VIDKDYNQTKNKFLDIFKLERYCLICREYRMVVNKTIRKTLLACFSKYYAIAGFL
jgi:hypothetical protein